MMKAETKQSRVLVSGGAGFLGSNLCKRLLLNGKRVVCVDNFSTGSRENLSRFETHPLFQFIEADICDKLDLPPFDEIYNLACPASPAAYQKDPIQTLKTNVLGTLNLLELARASNAKFFQASTSEVYGDPKIHPQEEEYWGDVNPIGLRSCYDEGKRCAETLCFDFYRLFQIPIKVGRIFNTYGPCMHPRDGRVISNFIVHALENEPLTLYGDGKQTRSFCYVKDLIDAIILFMDSPSVVTGPLNLGNPEEWHVDDVAKLIIELTGSRSPLIYGPLPSDDPKVRRPDISRAQSTLNWQPQVSLHEGVLETIRYFKEKKTAYAEIV